MGVEEEHPSVHFLCSSSWTQSFYDRMGIHNDGRAYAMIIRNDGQILWGSHDKFKENLQEKDMVRVMHEEVEIRVEEQRLLLEKTEAEAQLPDSPNGADPEVEAQLPDAVDPNFPKAESTERTTGSRSSP